MNIYTLIKYINLEEQREREKKKNLCKRAF